MKHRLKKHIFPLLFAAAITVTGLPEAIYADDSSAATSGTAEVEPNDDLESATPLVANTTMKGTLDNYNYRDVFEFKMPATGVVTFKVDSVSSENSKKITIEIRDKAIKDGHVNPDSFERHVLKPGESYTSTRLNFKKGKVIYIYMDSFCSEYSTTPQFTATTSWESEGNDSFKDATYLAAGKARYGSLFKKNDRDYYYFTAKKDGTVKISLSTGEGILQNGENAKEGYSIGIYDSKKKYLSINNVIMDGYHDNHSLRLSVKKGAKYYILIYSDVYVNSISRPVDSRYKVRVAYLKN